TDWLFVERATRHEDLDVVLRFLVRPVMMQIALLFVIGWSFWSQPAPDDAAAIEHNRPVSERLRRAAEISALLFCAIGVVMPLAFVTRELAAGWRLLMAQPGMVPNLLREIITPGLVALVAGLAVWNLARLSDSDRLHSRLCFVALLPGLCGNLT